MQFVGVDSGKENNMVGKIAYSCQKMPRKVRNIFLASIGAQVYERIVLVIFGQSGL
jgi:hypothetical protein